MPKVTAAVARVARIATLRVILISRFQKGTFLFPTLHLIVNLLGLLYGLVEVLLGLGYGFLTGCLSRGYGLQVDLHCLG